MPPVKSFQIKSLPFYLACFATTGLFAANLVYVLFYLFPGWDSAWYHLPHALKLVGILKFEYAEGSSYLYKIIAHPPLAHFIQGLFVKITGLIQAANWINPLALAGLFFFLHYAYRKSINLWATAVFMAAIPMISMHSSSGFIDMWVGCWSCAAAICLERLIGTKNHKWLYISLVAIIVMIYSKMTMWPLAAFIGSATAITGIYLCYKKNILRRHLIIYCGAGAFLAPLWAAYLQMTYGNMFFPYPSPIDPDAPYPDILPQYNANGAQDTAFWQSIVIAEPFLNWPHWKRYLTSFFEITRFWDDAPMIWSPDAFQQGTLHHRMGGYNVLVMAAGFLMMSWAAFKYIELRRAVVIFGLIFTVCAFTPQSYELRYFLIVPLFMSVIIGRYLAMSGDRYRTLCLSFVLPVLLLSSAALCSFTYMALNNFGPVIQPFVTGMILLMSVLVPVVIGLIVTNKTEIISRYFYMPFIIAGFVMMGILTFNTAQVAKTYFEAANMYAFIPDYMKQFWDDAATYIEDNGMPEKPFCHYPFENTDDPEASHYHFRAFWSGPSMTEYPVTDTCQAQILTISE